MGGWVREETVLFLSGLLHAERHRRGSRAGRRALGCFAHAVLVLRWFPDGTRIAQLATDNAIGTSTAYRYLHEGINVLAQRRPSLHGALLAAKAAGHSHINIDGTLIETDRVSTPGPTPRVDLWCWRTWWSASPMVSFGSPRRPRSLPIPLSRECGSGGASVSTCQ